jgi:hypothetical protein
MLQHIVPDEEVVSDRLTIQAAYRGKVLRRRFDDDVALFGFCNVVAVFVANIGKAKFLSPLPNPLWNNIAIISNY